MFKSGSRGFFNSLGKVKCNPLGRFTPNQSGNRYGPPLKSSFPLGRIVKYSIGAVLLGTVISGGAIAYKVYQENNPVKQLPQTPFFPDGQKKKTLVILGSGWGSIPLLKNLDTTLYNVVIVSPRNYFLFTPLLPSLPTGTVETRSIIEPVRGITRRCPGEVIYLEAEATSIDPAKNELTLKQSTTVNSGHSGKDTGSSKSTVAEYTGVDEITTTLNYDYLVVGVGAQPSTFGLPGVAEHSTFLKEISDASTIRKRLMDVIEAANLLPKNDPERKRLLQVVVCGGGPTGVETAGEIQDYIDQDLSKWIPDIQKELKVTLIEALPNVLNSFNKKLVDYTKQVFKDTNIKLLTNTMVKRVEDKILIANHKNPDGSTSTMEIPYGVLIWATGNATRSFTRDLMSKVEEQKKAKRGLLIDEYLKVDGTDNIYALGDCSFSKYPPTAQVAFQEGQYLATLFSKMHEIESVKYKIENPSASTANPETLARKLARLEKNLPKFQYNYQGALAYIGSEKAVADLVWGNWSNITSGGNFTFLFWRSAYIYMCLSVKNQVLVCLDWAKVWFFGRDCSKE